tara:strand:+ start:222 stop:836 length:615 start_codon:yes stop_codon:yes gene_type:complete
MAKDKKNLERKVHLRYCIQSGQSSIHGDTLYEIQSQEAQSFGFYGSTGEGASEGGGPGTGKAVLYTPGSYTEVLGEGLKVRKPGDITQLPAKIIKCKKGDVIIDCENGDITLKARNINLLAQGGGQDGQLDLQACRLAQVNAPDIRFQGEKILIDATNTCNVISKGFLQLSAAFTLAATESDKAFGVMSKILQAATTIVNKTLD